MRWEEELGNPPESPEEIDIGSVGKGYLLTDHLTKVEENSRPILRLFTRLRHGYESEAKRGLNGL
jgi:hypothetical protein